MIREIEARIETTNICNFKCTMCPREKMTRKKGIMDINSFIKLVQKLKEYGITRIALVGFGEPFIDPDIDLKVLICTKNNISTNIISNASLFHIPSQSGNNKTLIESCIDNGLYRLRLSIYGTTKEEHNSITHMECFDKILDNIKLLKTYKRNCIVCMNILDFNNNTDIIKYPDTVLDVIDYYEIWKPHNFGNGRNYRKIHNEKISCNRPQNGPLQILWNGDVVPCCYDYNGAMILGNIFTQDIDEIFSSPLSISLQNAHSTNIYTDFPYCDKCDQLLIDKCNNSIIYSNNPNHVNNTNKDIVHMTNFTPEVLL